MPLRIGFDMDGVLADFAAAYHQVESRLFGPAADGDVDPPEREEARQAGTAKPSPDGARDLRRRRDAIWQVIESTPDFWTTLAPLEPGAVRRIHELMLKYRWEVFFLTQRPATEGDTVQRQTQRWLVAQGFDLPSVLVIGGARGAAAGALRLDYHVDDSAQHCLDMIADSNARPLLVARGSNEAAIASARKLGIGVTAGIGQALEILERATLVQTNPNLLQKLATLVGWSR
ncbi:MAG TPA: hypothetical protein VD833_27095 [Vicinamibacterales bacterium]|nr:hypothetical protein [Vicinamibacterales bacterium]